MTTKEKIIALFETNPDKRFTIDEIMSEIPDVSQKELAQNLKEIILSGIRDFDITITGSLEPVISLRSDNIIQEEE